MCVGEPAPLPLSAGRGEAGTLQAPSSSRACGARQTGAGAGRKEDPREGPARSPQPSSARLLPPTFWQVKPVVSQFLREKQLPYNEDTYLARFRLFLSRYEELLVHAPPITELAGLQ